MPLASDFIECIPLSFRDDLYHQLEKWYQSDARKRYIDRTQNKERNEAKREERRQQFDKLLSKKRIK